LCPAFLRRFDRWLLLRAPMLWRTRLLQSLLLLSLLILLTALLVQSNIKYPGDVPYGLTILSFWWIGVLGAAVALGVWVAGVLRKNPVGELPLHRHIVTVVAVMIGSYLWLVSPTVFAYREISTIARTQPDVNQLNADLDLLTRYLDWECIPPSVWEKKDESEPTLPQLRDVLTRYYNPKIMELETDPSSKSCKETDTRQVRSSYRVYVSKEKIKVIQDAHNFLDGDSRNQFSQIRGSFFWFMAIALAIGLLTAIFSYPSYVWHRCGSR
jgi:hypothetical protein